MQRAEKEATTESFSGPSGDRCREHNGQVIAGNEGSIGVYLQAAIRRLRRGNIIFRSIVDRKLDAGKSCDLRELRIVQDGMKEVIPLIRLRHIGSLLQVICEALRRTLAPGTDDERDEGKKRKRIGERSERTEVAPAARWASRIDLPLQ